MSRRDQKKLEDRPTSIFSDLSACFKYLTSDSHSVLSDTNEIKNRPLEKIFAKSPSVNLQRTPLISSPRPNFDYPTWQCMISAEEHHFKDLVTPVSRLSKATALSDTGDSVNNQFMQKVNFNFTEKLQLTKSIFISRKDIIDTVFKSEDTTNIEYSMKRANIGLENVLARRKGIEFEDRVLTRNLRLFRKGIYKYKARSKNQRNGETVQLALTASQPVKCCSCKSSQCLKLYCECFKSQGLCSTACKCLNCRNRKLEDPERSLAVLKNSVKLQKISNLNEKVISTGERTMDVDMVAPSNVDNAYVMRCNCARENYIGAHGVSLGDQGGC